MYYIYCFTLCYSLLHYSLLHYIILHCIVLHCIILHCIFLYKKAIRIFTYLFVDNRYIIDAYNDSIHFSLRAVLWRNSVTMCVACIIDKAIFRSSDRWHGPRPKAVASSREFLSDPVPWVPCILWSVFIHCQLNLFIKATFECFWPDSINPLHWASVKELI